jgi:hypothetical protein
MSEISESPILPGDAASPPGAPATSERLPSWLASAAAWTLLTFSVSRFVIFGLILASRTVIVRANFWRPGGLLDVLVQWDGGWYLSIIRHGYNFSTERQSNMGFFPLYPLLAKIVSFIVPNIPLAAVLSANLCLIVAGYLLYRLVEIDYPGRTARLAVLFFMFSPVSFFFSSAYTESTFLMLAIGSFVAARQRNWLLASLLGMGVAATRQVGFLIVVPLFVEHLQQNWKGGVSFRALLHPRILLLVLVPCGFGLFMLYGAARFHDPLAFIHATAVWGRKFTSPINAIANAMHYDEFYRWLFVGALVVALILFGVGVGLRLRLSYLTYVALMILLYISSNSLEAMPRSLSVLFPLFIIVALIATRIEWLYEPLLAGSVALLALCTILFANGHWMT